MKLVIFAGGLGTRIGEETQKVPKPLIKIGTMPIIWHIMKYYTYFGIKDFIICLGYKGDQIKNFFLNYKNFNSEITINLKDGSFTSTDAIEDWQVTLLDTGEHTQTGGRLKRVEELVKNEEFFYLTYGDGLSDVNINSLTEFFIKKNKLCTLTAVRPKSRFGILEINKNNLVKNFQEKPDDKWINGGFFIMKPKVLDLINEDGIALEKQPMLMLTKKKELSAFKHNGFWQCMDTLNDKNYLEKLWDSGKAPWKNW
jgi:glucose-1-phosphate cytidylyltransferase